MGHLSFFSSRPQSLRYVMLQRAFWNLKGMFCGTDESKNTAFLNALVTLSLCGCFNKD